MGDSPWTAPGGTPCQDSGISHHTGTGRMCGAASMPLAFTQEDFLVSPKFLRSMVFYFYYAVISTLSLP